LAIQHFSELIPVYLGKDTEEKAKGASGGTSDGRKLAY
jgi:hypothetical protein